MKSIRHSNHTKKPVPMISRHWYLANITSSCHFSTNLWPTSSPRIAHTTIKSDSKKASHPLSARCTPSHTMNFLLYANGSTRTFQRDSFELRLLLQVPQYSLSRKRTEH